VIGVLIVTTSASAVAPAAPQPSVECGHREATKLHGNQVPRESDHYSVTRGSRSERSEQIMAFMSPILVMDVFAFSASATGVAADAQISWPILAPLACCSF
jgi:hypothetical protein